MRFPRELAVAVAMLLAASVGAAPIAGPAAGTSGAGTPAEQELTERLRRAELLAGLTEVSGVGLIVTLRHCPRELKGVDPTTLEIHDQDVNAILNALRIGGAEALAISGAGGGIPERIVLHSAASDRDGGIEINGTLLRPPYRILAIGNPATLRAELMRPEGVVKVAGLDTLEMIELQGSATLTIPAVREPFRFRYARSQEPTRLAQLPAPPVPTAPAGTPQTQAAPATINTRAPEPVKVAISETNPPTPVPPAPPASADPPRAAPPPTAKPQPAASKLEPVAPKPQPAISKPQPAAPVAPKPPAVPGSGAEPGVSAPVFGGKDLAKYHLAGCRFGERIEEGKRVTFASAEAASKAGRTPCKICRPDRPTR